MTGLPTILLLSALASGADTGFLNLEYKDPEGKTFKYVLFVPHAYQKDKPFPLIMFLHGAGEKGTDGKVPAEVGLGPAIKKREKSFPFFVLFPQTTAERVEGGRWKAGSDNSLRALAILDKTMKDYAIDKKRLYLTGLSMGGHGTWSWALSEPGKWAAMAPLCGGGDAGQLAQAAKIKEVPCWCFHGGADTGNPTENSRQMVAALKKAGGRPKYEEYPGVGHNCWDLTYAKEELYTWFLQHKLP